MKKSALLLAFLLPAALGRATPEEDAAFAAAASAMPVPASIDLQQAEMLATANHPRIAVAAAQAQAAQQQIREARSAFYPQVTANVMAVGVDNDRSQLAATGGLAASTVDSRQSDGLNATQLLTDFGRTSSLTSQARHLAASEQANAATTRADVLRDADEAYFTVLEARAIVRVADETVQSRQLVLDRVGALAQAQLKSDLDVSFAKVDLGNARLLQLQARSGLDEAFARLSDSLGYPESHTFQLADAEPYTAPTDDFKPLLEAAFRNRPEIASAIQQAEAAKKYASAQRAAQYPTIQAIGSAGVSPIRDNSALDSGYAAAGINVALPVLTGGKLSAQVAEADARAIGQERLLDGLRNDVARDVRTAWLRASTGYRKIGVSEALLANASQALDLAEARYTSGLSSIVELSRAQLNKTQAEIATASARYDYQILAAELKYQLGDFQKNP
jgi:outer membrane protein